jgi:diketogulonate reductase-like aldo/keto reductase
MRSRPFGHVGQVPVVGQGTWKMERDDRHEAIRALRRGLELGLSHIDTAEVYGNGVVETLVGEAFEGRRDDIFLVSKVAPDHATFDGTLRACEASLKRLRTDHLDCYLLHWPGPVPLADTVRGFEALVKSGKIRSWGLSNFDVLKLDDALAVAGPGRIACDQVEYHLDDRSVERGTLPWCVGAGTTLVAYSPFGAGRFPSDSSARGRVLAEVGRERGATPHQIALAYLLRLEGVVVIPKAARVAHVEEAAAAADLVLEAEDVRRLDAAFPLPRGAGGQPTL